jgi:hypothetical protein
MQSKPEVPTLNFFALLRWEADHRDNMDNSNIIHKAGWLPPIVLTSQVNLIQLQRQLKGSFKGNIHFHNTRNGTRAVRREMLDFSNICSHFNSDNLPHYMFYPKSQKPIKSVILHLPVSIPAVDISGGFVNLGLDVIRIK